MNGQKFDLNNLKIASPCPVGWDTMKGDDRKRFCDMCSLNVYNISEMTRSEAETFIRNAEGRICARIYRRADGTMITRDCPVGLRAYRKKAAAYAGAALSMVLGLFSAGYGQCKVKTDGKTISASKLNIVKTPANITASALSGTITDPNGALVTNIELVLLAEGSDKPINALSDHAGVYKFRDVKPGKYVLVVKPSAGFKGMAVKNLVLEQGSTSELDLSLQPGENMTVIVGVVGETPLIDTSSPGGRTVITRETLERLPINDE